MYFTLRQIQDSLQALAVVDAFFGNDFLAFKAGKLPVGSTTEFPADAISANFLTKFYKPDPQSSWYYRTSRTTQRDKHWVDRRYPGSAAQSTRTRGPVSKAFIHVTNTKTWGWQQDYVSVLKERLFQHRPVPMFDLAVWLYRDQDWPIDADASTVLTRFISDFHITDDERRELFSEVIPDQYRTRPMFQAHSVTWEELRTIIGRPPDASLEEGGTLAYLELLNVGPTTQLHFEPGDRINLITGDNGLGKTFLLECSWWALTGQWASGVPAYPRQDSTLQKSAIVFSIASDASQSERVNIQFDWNTQNWPSPRDRPTIPGLLVYARVDGSFAVWDPIVDFPASLSGPTNILAGRRPFMFSQDQVWDGVQEKVGNRTYVPINGLIRDLVAWQNKPQSYPYNTFKKVLRRLSPPDLGTLEPGNPVRLPYDDREYPTIKHPYGEIPLIHMAAGVRRIVTLAYLLVWAWEKHKTESRLQFKTPQNRMVILVDEIEAHLHPKWQRLILSALLDVREDLSPTLSTQMLIATHSPLVLASAEPIFDYQQDKLFHLNLTHGNLFTSAVELREVPFLRYGEVDSWLTSEIFELRSARSVEAETAIERAKQLQLQDFPDVSEIRQVSEQLVSLLPSDDEFWPRWTYFAIQHGVTI